MSVYYVERHSAGNHAGHDRIIVDFLNEVFRIAPRKFNTSEVVKTHIIEISVDMVAEVKISLRVHDLADSGIDIIP